MHRSRFSVDASRITDAGKRSPRYFNAQAWRDARRACSISRLAARRASAFTLASSTTVGVAALGALKRLFMGEVLTQRAEHGELILFERERGSVSYLLDWQGNDGTFATEGPNKNRIALPLDQAVTLRVRVSTRNQGIHSANLRLLDLQNALAGQMDLLRCRRSAAANRKQ
jgi:hypothetical protein